MVNTQDEIVKFSILGTRLYITNKKTRKRELSITSLAETFIFVKNNLYRLRFESSGQSLVSNNT